MIEREERTVAGRHHLSGTLCLPDATGTFPVVLMIHGTGPLDRNENMAGQKLDVFNAVAHRLAKSGVASLRYDKRGCGKSGGDYLTAGQTELMHDVQAWIRHLSALSCCAEQPLYLLGHSEGCLIAPRVSLVRPEVAGLILLAPSIAPLETTLMRQAAQVERDIANMPGWSGKLTRLAVKVLGAPVDRQRALIARLRSTDEPVLRLGPQRIAAGSLRDLLALDPRAIFERVRCPMLLVGGAKDTQCDPADVAVIAALCPQSEAYVVPDLAHVLRRDEGPPTLLGQAALLKKPVDPELLELVAGWLERQLGR